MKSAFVVDGATFVIEGEIKDVHCNYCKEEIRDIQYIILTGKPVVCEKCYENLSSFRNGENSCGNSISL